MTRNGGTRRAILGGGLAASLLPGGLLPGAFASRPALAAPPSIAFERFYKSFGVLGMQFSDELSGFAGRTVSLRGYMAPPLKPESDFFVLTREPLAICPFCQSDADWPLDIAVVHLGRNAGLAPAGTRVTVTGTLELGSRTDPRTGFVSQIRVVGADVAA